MMFYIFVKLKVFLKSELKSYVVGVLTIVISYVLIMIPPYMVGYLADRIMQQTIGLEELYLNLGFLTAVIVLSYISNYIWSYLIFRGAERMSYRTRGRLMAKFLLQSPIFFEKHSTGSLMGKSTNDVRALSDFAGYGIMAAFDAIVYPVVLLLVMGMSTSWRLTLALVVPLPALIVFSRYLGKKLYIEFDKAQQAFDNMNDSVLENVSSVRVVRAYNRESSENLRFSKTAEDLYDKNMKVAILNALYTPAVRIVPGMSYIIALSVGAYLIGQNTLTIGQLVAFIFYLSLLVWPMFALGEYINVSEQASASIDRIDDVLTYPEEVVDQSSYITYEGKGGIRFDHFSFSYPKSFSPVLKDITFTLPQGATLGIVGKIGSGKTTLVKQLLHLYPLQEQAIFLGDTPIEKVDRKSLRAHIGYVPQQHLLFSRTIADNIGFGVKNVSKAQIDEVVKMSDFTKDIDHLSQGLETLAGEKGISLSGGQKQRISIARALISDPDILILDDSLSAVDANTEATIINNMKENRKGKTTLIVAHRLSAISHADLIVVLDDGRIVEKGTHDELYCEKGWYRQQFDHQKLGGEAHEDQFIDKTKR